MGISGNWLDEYRLCGTGLNPSNHSFGIADYRDEMQDLEARRQLHRKNSFGAAYNDDYESVNSNEARSELQSIINVSFSN